MAGTCSTNTQLTELPSLAPKGGAALTHIDGKLVLDVLQVTDVGEPQRSSIDGTGQQAEKLRLPRKSQRLFVLSNGNEDCQAFEWQSVEARIQIGDRLELNQPALFAGMLMLEPTSISIVTGASRRASLPLRRDRLSCWDQSEEDHADPPPRFSPFDDKPSSAPQLPPSSRAQQQQQQQQPHAQRQITDRSAIPRLNDEAAAGASASEFVTSSFLAASGSRSTACAQQSVASASRATVSNHPSGSDAMNGRPNSAAAHSAAHSAAHIAAHSIAHAVGGLGCAAERARAEPTETPARPAPQKVATTGTARGTAQAEGQAAQAVAGLSRGTAPSQQAAAAPSPIDASLLQSLLDTGLSLREVHAHLGLRPPEDEAPSVARDAQTKSSTPHTRPAARGKGRGNRQRR